MMPTTIPRMIAFKLHLPVGGLRSEEIRRTPPEPCEGFLLEPAKQVGALLRPFWLPSDARYDRVVEGEGVHATGDASTRSKKASVQALDHSSRTLQGLRKSKDNLSLAQ